MLFNMYYVLQAGGYSEYVLNEFDRDLQGAREY